MSRLTWLAATALLLITGCGGEDGPGGDDAGGTGGTGQDQSELCATYRPHPETQPEVELTTCVPEDWPRTGFCWRTTDEPSCMSQPNGIAMGCVFVRDGSGGATPGTQTQGCAVTTDCIPGAIDNPECCEGPQPNRTAGWDCPATP